MYKISSAKIQNRQGGFTLIEAMVSMSIFVMVVGMAVGTVIVMIDANAKAQNLQQAATNLSFAFDSMSREIRTGTYYYGTDGTPPSSGNQVRDCTAGTCSAISFVESGGSLTESCTGGAGGGRISYRHQDDEIQRRLCAGDWQPITSGSVVVNDLIITVQHTDRSSSDTQSPLVTLYVEAEVPGVNNTEAVLQLQSSVTQQAVDI